MASVQVGDHAPDFTLTSQSGQQVSLANYGKGMEKVSELFSAGE
jgi:peroxiredoxin